MYQTFLRGTVPRGPFRRGHLCLFIRACSLVRVLGSVFLYAFDLIELNGDDLRREPLETHKATLASLLLPGLRLNEHLAHDGERYSATSARWAFEGIVSKRLGSRYRSGR